MTKYPGWRTMTAAQRYNTRMFAMFDHAKKLKVTEAINESRRRGNTPGGAAEMEMVHYAKVHWAEKGIVAPMYKAITAIQAHL